MDPEVMRAVVDAIYAPWRSAQAAPVRSVGLRIIVQVEDECSRKRTGRPLVDTQADTLCSLCGRPNAVSRSGRARATVEGVRITNLEARADPVHCSHTWHVQCTKRHGVCLAAPRRLCQFAHRPRPGDVRELVTTTTRDQPCRSDCRSST